MHCDMFCFQKDVSMPSQNADQTNATDHSETRYEPCSASQRSVSRMLYGSSASHHVVGRMVQSDTGSGCIFLFLSEHSDHDCTIVQYSYKPCILFISSG